MFLLVLLAANTVFADAQWVGTILDEITIQHQPYVDCDFNNYGVVDSLDIGLFSGNWLGTGIWPKFLQKILDNGQKSGTIMVQLWSVTC